MRIYGKVFGAILGWVLLRHPAGAVLGAILGHVLDAGWLSTKRPGAADGADHEALAQAYRALGVEPSASDEDVERAYRRRISDYHPDKVAGAADEIRQLAETRAREINTAYEAIQKLRKLQRGE
jgi:hypothetical protein